MDYYHDPSAPPANSLVPGASAIVTNAAGEVLLQRRSDNSRWALPGGTMDVGETLGETIIREVHEETGLSVQIDRIVGIYSDPNHVFAYDDGEVRQEFSICFACRLLGGEIQASSESLEVAFFPPEAIRDLDMHQSIRRRIEDYFDHQGSPVIA